MTTTPTQSVTFWFDPICPFTWRTSRWLADVAERRDLSVDWQVMSLYELNKDNEMPDDRRAMLQAMTERNLFLQAVGLEHGSEAVGACYSALGRRVHEEGLTEVDAGTYGAVLAEAGLPEQLAHDPQSDEVRDALAASHAAGQQRAGQPSGSPIHAIGDAPAFFGPIVVPIPTGDEADRLFDLVSLSAQVPSLSEIKRARQPL